MLLDRQGILDDINAYIWVYGWLVETSVTLRKRIERYKGDSILLKCYHCERILLLITAQCVNWVYHYPVYIYID